MKAPAKINLTLRIVSRREDGYHEISSIMRAVSLFDEVRIGLHAGSPGVQVRADMEGVPDGPGNLAYRAAEAAVAAWGCGRAPGGGNDGIAPAPSIGIALKKGIPLAAGLAGGSSDAAAVLLGLAKALAPDAAVPEIAALGAGLGADVPFCVYACAAANPGLGYAGAGAALAEGAGERISPLGMQGKAQALLVKPAIGIPTKEAYELFDARGAAGGGSDNDFEAVCADAWPVVGETLRALKGICAEAGAAGAKVQLSGSGPTVFAYLENRQAEAAGRIYSRAKKAFPGMFVYLAETL